MKTAADTFSSSFIDPPASLPAPHASFAGSPAAFHFVARGRLVAGELEWVNPDARLVDDVVAAAEHPLTRRDAPAEANVTRQRLLDFLAASPGGRQAPDPSRGWVPQYNFWMRVHDRPFRPAPLSIAGGVSLRIGTGEA